MKKNILIKNSLSLIKFNRSNIFLVIPTTTVKPTIVGDPHVRVGIPNEPAICFDVTDKDQSILSLIKDVETGLEVNGQVFTEDFKKEKSRLERIGIVSPHGVQIGIYTDEITIGTNDLITERYSYEENVSKGMSDVHFVIRKLEKGTPKRGITVAIGSNSEIRFNVFIKRHKDSMIFEIERSGGSSQNLAGILGQTMRGQTKYHVYENGEIEVNER